MGLFKVNPAKIYKRHASNLKPKDRNKHVLIATEPCNGETSINRRANGLIDGMRKHDYQIIKFYVSFHLTSQFTMIIIYK